ncbi:hypothetical protein [Mycobacterium nebraskense]|uniref:hypothetical protein n=1 Tax=Mycobacterium nebraskense TaxID=244292 RepID=UPI0011404CE9|nr:hypothetical protein [Mycobacterium nebraskense]MBI2696838.1 hypothetical protein [Mycobacterium nebraskense]MCV7118425.1 hypothetical protein [Mycobacterium nebraskense]
MGNGQARTAATLCACGAALVVAFGWSAGDATARAATAPSSSSVTPAPPPTPGGALPVQPAGGGGCIIGLNCGCTRNCHKPHPRPPDVAGDPQHGAPAPAPQDP